MINSLSLNQAGGAIPAVNGTPTDFNGGTPVLQQKLCAVDALPAAFLGGFGFTADGRLCVSITAVPRSWMGGLPLGPNGRLCCSVAQPVVFFLRGVPFDANGRVVLANNPI